MAKHKEKVKYSKVIVALCLVTIITYTSICMFYLWHGRPLNDVLTALFFGCFGVEFASLAFVRRGEMRWVEGQGDRKVGHVESVEEEKDEQG